MHLIFIPIINEISNIAKGHTISIKVFGKNKIRKITSLKI
jgi:hypothetical protein